MENNTLNNTQEGQVVDIPFVPANENGEKVMREAIHFMGPDPTTVQYLLLMAKYNETEIQDALIDNFDDMTMTWGTVVGRQTVYDFLKYEIEHNQLDPDKSFIIAMPCQKLSSVPNVTQFMRHMKESGKVLDHTEFNIDEHHYYSLVDGEEVTPKTLLEILANGDIVDSLEEDEEGTY